MVILLEETCRLLAESTNTSLSEGGGEGGFEQRRRSMKVERGGCLLGKNGPTVEPKNFHLRITFFERTSSQLNDIITE